MKQVDYDDCILKVSKKINISKGIIVLFNFIALFAVINNCFHIFQYGSSFFSLSVGLKRSIINNGISHYINLFMITYSLFLSLYIIGNKIKLNSKSIYYNIFIVCAYWLTVLTCERRMFVTFVFGFVFLILYKYRKINLKKIILLAFTFLLLLFSASVRDNITFKTHKIIDVIYSSTTEFYCTFMISDAYVVNKHDLLYGKTYILDSLSKLVPRAILTNKSEDLSFTFKNEFNTNVGFSFNPIAEGILNFGIFAPLFVALLMILICRFANILKKRNILYYLIIYVFVFDFCRGAFSNMFFDILLCFFLIFLLFKITIKYNR